MKGLVIRSTGNAYSVWFEDERVLDCHVKGNFRIRGIRSTNPIAVGDWVEVEAEAGDVFWITEIYDRNNYIIRRSTNLSKQSHILACNLDQVALLVTLAHPETSTTFVDRFLASAEAYRVPVTVLINKVDLLTNEQQEQLRAWTFLYEGLGYPVVTLSAKHLADAEHEEEFKMVQDIFLGKITLMSGNSGVGKSTLLNAMFGEELTRTGMISSAHDKGMHTTTFSEMYRLKDKSGWVIDTPGIKGFGTLDMQPEEVGHYFKEIFHYAAECRYSNCLHTGEPGCAVVPEVGKHIAMSRYDSYLSMLNDGQEEKYR